MNSLLLDHEKFYEMSYYLWFILTLEKVIGINIDQTCALAKHSHLINYFFYNLPTRGRAGIKLGDADTSPTYL